MSRRIAGLRQRIPRRLNLELLEDRRLLSGAPLLGSPLLPVPLAAALSVGLAPAGVSVSITVETSGTAPALTATPAGTTNPGTPSVLAPAANVAVQTPVASVSAAVSLAAGTGDGGSTGGGVAVPGAPSTGGSLTVSAGQNGSGSVAVGSTSNGNGGPGVPLPNLGGNTTGGAAPGVAGPGAVVVPPPAVGSNPTPFLFVQPAAGSDPAPFLVPALTAGTSGFSQSALAIALSREAATQAAPPALTTVPMGATPSFARETVPDAALDTPSPSTADKEPAPTALRAASNLDEEAEGDSPAQEQAPDEAADAGLMGLVPADGLGIDQASRQLLDQLNNLGDGLNKTLPGGLAFWVLAGAVGLTACVTVRRSQTARAVLVGEALAWIPSLTGFLPPAGEE